VFMFVDVREVFFLYQGIVCIGIKAWNEGGMGGGGEGASFHSALGEEMTSSGKKWRFGSNTPVPEEGGGIRFSFNEETVPALSWERGASAPSFCDRKGINFSHQNQVPLGRGGEQNPEKREGGDKD